MQALAQRQATVRRRSSSRQNVRPICSICADSMVAAEASAFLSEDVITYLWTCDTCGYGFVTKHAMPIFACN